MIASPGNFNIRKAPGSRRRFPRCLIGGAFVSILVALYFCYLFIIGHPERIRTAGSVEQSSLHAGEIVGRPAPVALDNAEDISPRVERSPRSTGLPAPEGQVEVVFATAGNSSDCSEMKGFVFSESGSDALLEHNDLLFRPSASSNALPFGPSPHFRLHPPSGQESVLLTLFLTSVDGAPCFGHAELKLRSSSPDETRVTFDLSSEINGFIHDVGGSPVADVMLRLQPDNGSKKSAFERSVARHFSFVERECCMASKTDAVGFYRFRSLSPGKYFLNADGQKGQIFRHYPIAGDMGARKNIVVETITSSIAIVDFTAEAAPAFSVVVKGPDGRPVEGAVCQMSPVLSFKDGFLASPEPATSDSQGIAVMRFDRGISDGLEYRLLCVVDGFEFVYLPIVAVSRDGSILVQLRNPGQAIRGRVMDPRGMPISGVSVRLSHDVNDQESPGWRNFASTVTDSNGEFRFRVSKPTSAHRISVRAHDYRVIDQAMLEKPYTCWETVPNILLEAKE